ncbi:MAG: DUF3575 domain-containing protein [Bacteroidetes bacterium]|jgi:hypothetical protein|nr:DUF3575 domain-containing protein [Bacteroidota bacterium]
MKKLQFLFLIVLLALPGLGRAQDLKNGVKLNLLSPFVRTVSGFYERSVNDNLSAQLGVFYTFGLNTADTRFSGFGVTPEFRFYVMDKGAMQGFYVAPFLRYQTFRLEADYTEVAINASGGIVEREQTEKATFSTFGGGVLAGYQWIFGKRVMFDIYLGPSYNSGSVSYEDGRDENNSEIEVRSINGFGIRFGTTLGVAF